MQSHLKLENSKGLAEELCHDGCKQLAQKQRQIGHLRSNCLSKEVVIVLK